MQIWNVRSEGGYCAIQAMYARPNPKVTFHNAESKQFHISPYVRTRLSGGAGNTRRMHNSARKIGVELASANYRSNAFTDRPGTRFPLRRI